ncbi:hypothetical protein FRC17_006082 [Serendipita sp. 399]|nr:hypothetical protein FRC17_006082 [Serendipita sp. 399]
MSELTYSGAHYGGPSDGRPSASRRLPAIPGPGAIGRSPAPHSPDPYRHEPPRSLQGHTSRPSSSDPHGYMRRPIEHDEFGQRLPHSESYSRQPTGRAEHSQAQTLPSRPMWSTVLDPNGEAPSKPSGKDTFVTIEPNETMTMAFQPHGLLQAGMQDKQSRSAKQQEAMARETGASLVNVPPAPPPPQMGLVGAITAHQRDRDREGGIGATLTDRERERRLAEERQRKYDELQRAQLENMSSGAMQQNFNPMMMNPMYGWGMPMMYPMGGMGMSPWGSGMTPQQQQQQQYQMWAAQQAQQAAMQAYQQAMISISQAGSQVGSEAGDHMASNPAARGGAVSPMPGWGMPMSSPMMTPMMMPGMMGMPGMMPGFGGSGFMQPPSVSPQPGRSPIGDENRFSFAQTPHDSPQPRPNDTTSAPQN